MNKVVVVLFVGLLVVFCNFFPLVIIKQIQSKASKCVTPYLFWSNTSVINESHSSSVLSLNINEEFEDIIVETTASSDEDDFIDDSPQESTESIIKEEIEEIITTEHPEVKTEESTEPIEHSTQLLIEDQTKHTVKEKTVKKHTPLKKSRLQPKKKKQKQKKTQSENEVVILPSLEVQPFDKHYRLVFFTTVELFNKKNPPQRVTNTFRMFELFQRSYNFRAVVYTNSPVIIQLCSRLGIYTEGNYEVNIHNMPLIRYMYNRTSHLVSSDYYGYINSDIVVTPNIFETLDFIENMVKEGKVKPKHEVASIVWDIFRLGSINTTSIEAYEDYLRNKMQYLKGQRDYRSADYFIFSAAVNCNHMEDAVIGRIRIDNYILSYIFQEGGTLVDATRRVISLHQGLDGYKEHTRSGKLQSDLDWNVQWARDIKKIKGSLSYANIQLPASSYSIKIFERSRERTNIVKLKKMSKERMSKLKIFLPY